VTARARRQWLLESLALAVAIILLSGAGLAVVRATGEQYPVIAARLTLPWVPFGLTVGAVFLRGPNRWPGALLGVLAVQLLFVHATVLFSLTQATAFTLSALAIRALLRAWRVNPEIERWRDPLLLWLAAGSGALLLAVSGIAGALLSVKIDPHHLDAGLTQMAGGASATPALSVPLFLTAVRWWANWTSGVALVLPSLYALRRSTWREYTGRSVELTALVLAVATWGLVSLTAAPWVAHLPIGVVAVLIVTWAAIRFGAPVCALVTLALSLLVSGSFLTDRGAMQVGSGAQIGDVWSLVATLALLGMLITSLLAERDAASRRQAASEARYRALFDSNPRPLWVHDPASLSILIANEAAVRHYGYTREAFTRLNLTDLEAGAGEARAAGGASGLDSGEHRHRTRDGSVIAVELHSAPIEFEGRPARLVFSDDVTDRNRLRGALLDASDRAGRELGQELHDGLGQELVALTLIARSQRTLAGSGRATDPSKLDLIESIAVRALETCRNVARGLSALAETGGDLQGALERLPARFRHDGPPVIRVTINDNAELTLPVAARDHIYRIAQEALTNAVKHAGAQTIEIRCDITAELLTLSVRDDGIGLRPGTALSAGLGRASMRHRAAAIGARLHVTTVSGGGTELSLECPQRPREQRSGG
jgi:PAS domain S-box-containing protein